MRKYTDEERENLERIRYVCVDPGKFLSYVNRHFSDNAEAFKKFVLDCFDYMAQKGDIDETELEECYDKKAVEQAVKILDYSLGLYNDNVNQGGVGNVISNLQKNINFIVGSGALGEAEKARKLKDLEPEYIAKLKQCQVTDEEKAKHCNNVHDRIAKALNSLNQAKINSVPTVQKSPQGELFERKNLAPVESKPQATPAESKPKKGVHPAESVESKLARLNVDLAKTQERRERAKAAGDEQMIVVLDQVINSTKRQIEELENA